MTTMAQATTQHHDHKGWPALLELATREVFQIMLGAELALAAPPEVLPPGECSAMVGFAGQLCGVLSIHCTARTANQVAASMLGIPLDQVNEQAWDALGEVCNMVAGNFKNKLTHLSANCMLSVPTVIAGGDYRVRSLAGGESMQVSFLFEGELIRIELEIQS
jgi:chemotaxis protein CheX